MLKKIDNLLFHYPAIHNLGLEHNAGVQLAHLLYRMDGSIGNCNRIESKRIPGGALIEVDGSITFNELQDLYEFLAHNDIAFENQKRASGVLFVIRDAAATEKEAALLTYWLAWRSIGVEGILNSEMMPDDKEDCIADIHDILVSAVTA